MIAASTSYNLNVIQNQNDMHNLKLAPLSLEPFNASKLWELGTLLETV